MKKCIRFKLQPGIETFNDLVCGEISLDVASIEGDPVILKSDELPTYHLASVIDDHHMKISHVLRGIEWQSSTTKHIFLYKAFGWQPPQFAHLPLMLNSNGTKLSKRQGDITIEHFRQSGIKPRALLNFITVTGGGFQREPDDKKLIVSHSIEKLSLMFDMKLLVANSSRVNFKRLEDYNRSELIRQISNPKELSSLISELKYLIKDTLEGRIDGSLELDDDLIKGVLLWSQKRIHRLNDLVGPDLSFIWVRPTLQQFEPSEPDIFKDLITKLNVNDDCTKEELNLLLREHAEKHEVPYRIFMKQMRSLLSGLKEGPSVAEMLEILGRKTSALRIQRAIDYIELNKRAVV
uniref:Uncharacterized protein n=2 Tax=Clastoptera arizonana TaxID=38151 RepID=A0A1B6DXG8_9HEMI